jgi:hypothetical protein
LEVWMAQQLTGCCTGDAVNLLRTSSWADKSSNSSSSSSMAGSLRDSSSSSTTISDAWT